jgi:hypothetical protein
MFISGTIMFPPIFLDQIIYAIVHNILAFVEEHKQARAAASIQPVQKITAEKWVWHPGLDWESSRLLNDWYEGQGVSEDRMARLLSLFRLEFSDPTLLQFNN